MRRHLFTSSGLAAVVAALAVLAACGGQPPADTAGTDDMAADGATLRTAWGDPDLQGTWETLERVPFERPAEFGDREFMTEEPRPPSAPAGPR